MMALLEEMVASKEQKVISAIAALVAARTESKMWLSLQGAVCDYVPFAPHLGATEERFVWEPMRDALRQLLPAPHARECSLTGFVNLSHVLRAAYAPVSGSDVRADSPVDREESVGDACSSTPASDQDGSGAQSSSQDRPAAREGLNLPENTEPAPLRLGLRGVLALEDADFVGVRQRLGINRDHVAAGVGGAHGVRQAERRSEDAPAAVPNAGEVASGSATDEDHGSVLISAARSMGEAVLALDALGAERLKRLSDELEEPPNPEGVKPVFAAVGLAGKVSNFMDSCTVNLLEEWIVIERQKQAFDVHRTPEAAFAATSSQQGNAC